jgi:hypothetical protein
VVGGIHVAVAVVVQAIATRRVDRRAAADVACVTALEEREVGQVDVAILVAAHVAAGEHARFAAGWPAGLHPVARPSVVALAVEETLRREVLLDVGTHLRHLDGRAAGEVVGHGGAGWPEADLMQKTPRVVGGDVAQPAGLRHRAES